jgi:hypothetical protein
MLRAEWQLFCTKARPQDSAVQHESKKTNNDIIKASQQLESGRRTHPSEREIKKFT